MDSEEVTESVRINKVSVFCFCFIMKREQRLLINSFFMQKLREWQDEDAEVGEVSLIS